MGSNLYSPVCLVHPKVEPPARAVSVMVEVLVAAPRRVAGSRGRNEMKGNREKAAQRPGPVSCTQRATSEAANTRAIGDFFGSVLQDGRLDEICLVPTSANRQPALAAYSRDEDGMISGIVGFPDPWLFERCGCRLS
jgi:hypothetical protein